MEIVILSGKGGTGKTTIAKALSQVHKPNVRVDADVDAPNFYLYSGGDIKLEEIFYGGKKVVRDTTKCMGCGRCEDVCKYGAITKTSLDLFACEGCGACTYVCPQNALQLVDDKGADVFISKDEDGILSHAQMEIGADGSGKLITELRKNAKKFNKDNFDIIIDGSPGIGCAVMASLTNTQLALLVTEPTISGLSDMKRAYDTCKYFKVPAIVCINKYGLNDDMTNQIEDFCKKEGIEVVGRIPYDDMVRQAINKLKPITDYKESEASKAIYKMYEKMKKYL